MSDSEKIARLVLILLSAGITGCFPSPDPSSDLPDHDLVVWAYQKKGRTKSRLRSQAPARERLEDPGALFASFLLEGNDCSPGPEPLIELSGPGLSLMVRLGNGPGEQPACSFSPSGGIKVTVPLDSLQPDIPGAVYITYERDRYLTLFINGQLVEFIPVRGPMPSGPSGITLENNSASLQDPIRLPPSIQELVLGTRIPDFEQRYAIHALWEEEFGLHYDLYPVHQYYNMIMQPEGLIVRDPSEILHINGMFWVYFTGVRAPERDGFKGSIYVSSCADTKDPAIPENWALPVEVIPKGNPETDHDGTGCFTPDCYYDGSNVFVFYTGLNSTHPRGFPQWGPVKEPEHIMVARSDVPDRDFVKTPKHTQLTPGSRALDYDEATIPGGHEYLDGKPLYDVSLIDHGQCWVMDNGEQLYYYKGGGGDNYSVAGHRGHHGAVCLVRGLDENWLNGQRYSQEPVIYEDSHMEGILITRVRDRLFLQAMVFGPPRLWVTYTSHADDGIHWRSIGGHHWPKPDSNYPLSTGVYPTVNPEWGIGQFPAKEGYIGLAYIKIL